MARKHGATAKDIAEKCNVSQATVSYVINDTEGKRVSSEKRAEILKVAKELNYFPNAAARSIRQQHCTSVGVVPGNNYMNPGFGEALGGIKHYLDSIGYTLTLLGENRDCQKEEIVKSYYSDIICGVIFLAFDTQHIDTSVLKEKNIPYVILSENGVSTEGSSPKKAFENVIYDCISFCREKNLKNICYFTRTIGSLKPHNKYDLIVKAINDIYPGCSFERIVCQTTADGSDDEIILPIKEYLSCHSPDIAITPNQRIGLLTQMCLLQKDFVIPQKIKHICLSSSYFLFNTYPRLSSLYIPNYEMGLYAAKLMMDVVKERPIEEKDFKCLLVHGDTTAF